MDIAVTRRNSVLVLCITRLHLLLAVIVDSGMVEFQVVTAHKVNHLRDVFSSPLLLFVLTHFFLRLL